LFDDWGGDGDGGQRGGDGVDGGSGGGVNGSGYGEDVGVGVSRDGRARADWSSRVDMGGRGTDSGWEGSGGGGDGGDGGSVGGVNNGGNGGDGGVGEHRDDRAGVDGSSRVDSGDRLRDGC
jgi:hypothetical protein